MRTASHELCLRVRDLEASRKFYEALGMEVVRANARHVKLTNGDLYVTLMVDLAVNWITIRGADVQGVYERMKASGVNLGEGKDRFGRGPSGEPQTYSRREMGSDGQHWLTTDPDGNAVYLDTTAEEAEERFLVSELIQSIERQLAALKIESKAFGAFKAELQAEYLS